MTRANINFIWQKQGKTPHILFFYHNGDQYPEGLRDYFNVIDFVKEEWTQANFKKWIRKNYKAHDEDIEDLGEDGQPKIYYTGSSITDYSYIFELEWNSEKKILVYNWSDKIFEGNDKEFIKWIKKQKII